MRESFVERLVARHEPVAGGEVVDERQLGVDLLEALRRQPPSVRLRPGIADVHAAVAQEQLLDPVAAAHQIGPDPLGRAARSLAASNVADGTATGRQRPRHQLAQQQVSVAAV